MDETEIKYVIEAALLAAGRPLTIERLGELFTGKGPGLDRATLKRVLEALAADYQGRGIELAEVSSGYRIQVKRSMSDWLIPLWEERAPRYTRALLETLALIAYRQPITRAEIEEVRGVVVSTNIMRTLLERNWVRVVGHRDVPGKPAMFGTTREFLDYFGLKKLEDLPPLAELKDGLPELSPQTDLIESLEAEARGELPAAFVNDELMQNFDSAGAGAALAEHAFGDAAPSPDSHASSQTRSLDDADDEDDEEDAFEIVAEGSPDTAADTDATDFDSTESTRTDREESEPASAEIIPLRAAPGEADPAE